MIDELTQFFVLVFVPSENEHVHGGDTGVDVNIPEGMEGAVKVKVLPISDNVAHSEDEEG